MIRRERSDLRYFEPITIDELKAKVAKATENGEIPLWEINKKVMKDLSKVEFSTENYEDGTYECKWGPAPNLLGYQELQTGLTFLGVHAGGDWELPVFWIIYWDGASLRSYIPEFGNWYNTKLMAAYGNNENEDVKNIKERCGVEVEEVDQFDLQNEELIIVDINNRIVPKKSQKETLAKRVEALRYYGSEMNEGGELFLSLCSVIYQLYGIDKEERAEKVYEVALEVCNDSREYAKEENYEFLEGQWG